MSTQSNHSSKTPSDDVSGRSSLGPQSPSGQRKKTPPPSLRDMISITLGLVVVCLLSAIVLGLAYIGTEPIRIRNAQEHESTSIRQLLEIPPSGKMVEVRRYLNRDHGQGVIFYATPQRLVGLSSRNQITPEGVVSLPNDISTLEGEARREALDLWMKTTRTAQYVGRFFIGFSGSSEPGSSSGKSVLPLGYVVEGETLGYKSRVRFFIALEENFTIRGVEIIEQEEDPGLGGEISQKYFKNQFSGRPAQEVEGLIVSRDPLPGEWKKVLESLGSLPYSQWRETNQEVLKKHPQIYSITGSTISSTAITNGVKKTLDHFRRRFELLKSIHGFLDLD